MKLNSLIFTTLAAVGLIAGNAPARPHHRNHFRPHVNFGLSFGFNAPAPVVYRPVVYAQPYYTYQPVVTPVVYRPVIVRPQFGFSFGSGPFGFGFSI